MNETSTNSCADKWTKQYAETLLDKSDVEYSNTPGLYLFKSPVEVNVIFTCWVNQFKTWMAGL